MWDCIYHLNCPLSGFLWYNLKDSFNVRSVASLSPFTSFVSIPVRGFLRCSGRRGTKQSPIRDSHRPPEVHRSRGGKGQHDVCAARPEGQRQLSLLLHGLVELAGLSQSIPISRSGYTCWTSPGESPIDSFVQRTKNAVCFVFFALTRLQLISDLRWA